MSHSSIPAKYYDEENLICAVPLSKAESYGQTSIDDAEYVEAEYVEVGSSPVEKPSDETPTNYTPADTADTILRSVVKPVSPRIVPAVLGPIANYVQATPHGKRLIYNAKNGAAGYEGPNAAGAGVGMSYPMDPDQHVVLVSAAKGKPSAIGIEDDRAGMSYAVKDGEVEIVPADPKKKSALYLVKNSVLYATEEGALVAGGKDEPESAPVKALIAGHCELCGKPLDEPVTEAPADEIAEVVAGEEELMGPPEEGLGNPVEVQDVNQGKEPTAKAASEPINGDQPSVVVTEAAITQSSGKDSNEQIIGKMVAAHVVGGAGDSGNSGARPEVGTVTIGLTTQPGARVVAEHSEPQPGTSGASLGASDRLAGLGRGEIHPANLSAASEPVVTLGAITSTREGPGPQGSPVRSVLAAAPSVHGNGSKSPRAVTSGNSATDGATRLDDAVLAADARTADASNVIHAGQRPVHATAGDARGAAGDNADSHDLARKFDQSLNTVQGQGSGADSNMHGEGDDRGLEIARAALETGDGISEITELDVNVDQVFVDTSSPSIYS